MGDFYPEITVERGLTRALRKVQAQRRRKGKRTQGDPTRITVRDMKMGEFAGGSFSVRSSNLALVPLSGGWSSGAHQRLCDRRSRGGDEKGRVLYGILETVNNGTMAVAALTYHYERAGEVVITGIEATGELNDHRPRIEQALTIVAERIAIETSKGKKGRLLWEMSRYDASRVKQKLGFREHTRPAKNRVILVRDADLKSLTRASRVTH